VYRTFWKVMYPILAILFFLTIIFSILLVIGFIFKPKIWKQNLSKIKIFFITWYVPYFAFILFFTGPINLNQYPSQDTSPYKLPWKSGISRFVAQGNRSFTSHRDFHLYAWDFVMPIGTEILAAREGKVIEVEDSLEGIGIKANYLKIEHQDGEHSVYAHIKNKGALVKVGTLVLQGQPIALSGMVGQAPGPHLHFYVTNKDDTSSIPISFRDVSGGIPLAGRFYISGNDFMQPENKF
jgi:murein DD-endopeptidase MepM/ murein hydrolase activator NlpD